MPYSSTECQRGEKVGDKKERATQGRGCMKEENSSIAGKSVKERQGERHSVRKEWRRREQKKRMKGERRS